MAIGNNGAEFQVRRIRLLPRGAGQTVPNYVLEAEGPDGKLYTFPVALDRQAPTTMTQAERAAFYEGTLAPQLVGSTYVQPEKEGGRVSYYPNIFFQSPIGDEASTVTISDTLEEGEDTPGLRFVISASLEGETVEEESTFGAYIGMNYLRVEYAIPAGGGVSVQSTFGNYNEYAPGYTADADLDVIYAVGAFLTVGDGEEPLEPPHYGEDIGFVREWTSADGSALFVDNSEDPGNRPQPGLLAGLRLSFEDSEQDVTVTPFVNFVNPTGEPVVIEYASTTISAQLIFEFGFATDIKLDCHSGNATLSYYGGQRVVDLKSSPDFVAQYNSMMLRLTGVKHAAIPYIMAAGVTSDNEGVEVANYWSGSTVNTYQSV
jgi:hypothetical protein